MTSADPMTRTRSSWASMHARCKPDYPGRNYYADRGITVCNRWASFDAFLEDMGLRPEGLTLDRKDNDGCYTPENCRWATRRQQVQNRRCTVYVQHEGQKIALTKLAEDMGVSDRSLRRQLDTPTRVGIKNMIPPSAMEDEPIDECLRRLILSSNRSLQEITREAGVDYFRVYGWVSKRTTSMDMVIGDKLLKVLRGKGIVQ